MKKRSYLIWAQLKVKLLTHSTGCRCHSPICLALGRVSQWEIPKVIKLFWNRFQGWDWGHLVFQKHQKHIILVENIQLGYDIKFDIDFLDLFMTYIASNLEMICSSKLYSNCSKLIWNPRTQNMECVLRIKSTFPLDSHYYLTTWQVLNLPSSWVPCANCS